MVQTFESVGCVVFVRDEMMRQVCLSTIPSPLNAFERVERLRPSRSQ